MDDGLSAGHRLAGYDLVRAIGQGSHGTVYLAREIAGGEVVALKVVPLAAAAAAPAAHAAFLRSAQTALALVHPGIVALRAAGIEGNLGWLAMEPVPGTDLARYVAAPRLLPEPLVLRIGERVALALAYAHARGVVHRDIKPANVLVDWAGDAVKLADFGLARADDGVQTGTGIVLGSPAYMAPEQLAGALPSPRSDIHALGVMLFQLLAGRLPYEGASMGELLRQVSEAPVPDLGAMRPGLPREVTALIARMLAKRPGGRPEGGEALAAALRRAAAAWPQPR